MKAIDILKASFDASGNSGAAVQLFKRGIDTPNIRRAAGKHRFFQTVFRLKPVPQFGRTAEYMKEVTAREAFTMRLSVYRTPDGTRHIAGCHMEAHWPSAREQIKTIPEEAIPLVASIEDHVWSGMVPNSGGGENHASSGYIIVNGRRYEGGHHSGTSNGYGTMAYSIALQRAVADLYKEQFGIGSL